MGTHKKTSDDGDGTSVVFSTFLGSVMAGAVAAAGVSGAEAAPVSTG